MYISKKKNIIKSLWVVALVGLTLAILCTSVFADDMVVPDNAVTFYLNTNSYWVSQNALSNWYQITSGSVGISAGNHAYVSTRFDTRSGETIQYGYTYYLTFYFRNGTYYHYIDNPQLYISSTSPSTDMSDFKSVRDLGYYSFFITYGNPSVMKVVFRANEAMNGDTHIYPQFLVYNDGEETIESTWVFNTGTQYYDLDGSVYDGIVLDQLEDISSNVDNIESGIVDVNNNLVILDNSINSMNELQAEKLEDIHDKLEQASQQQHQDSLNEQQAINDLPANQYNYEHQQDTNSANQIQGDADDEFETIDNYADIEGFQESIGQLATSFMNTNKSYTLSFPPSGRVPILNKNLWSAKTIDLQPIINSTPGTILIIACNGIFSFVAIVGLINFIRRVVLDILQK